MHTASFFQLAHTLAHARVPQSPNSIPNKIGSIQPLLCTTHLLDISGDPMVVTQAAAQSPPKPHTPALWRAVQFSHPLPQTHFRIVAIPVSLIVDKQTSNLLHMRLEVNVSAINCRPVPRVRRVF
jgi:hypothetical protein